MSETQVPALKALAALTPEQRRSLGRSMKQGAHDPDPEVASAAYRWSHDPRWNRYTNRLPGWFLSLVGLLLGVAFVAVAVALQAPPAVVVAFTIAFVLVILMGLVGWMQTSTARKLRRIYPADPSVVPEASGDPS